MSQLRCIIRPMYSSPPKHGSSIVKTVLSDSDLTSQYYKECSQMAERIQTMRNSLVEAIKEAGSTHDWSHVKEQIGMFAYTGMSAEMCDQLTDEYAIFLTRDGRISIAGLNDGKCPEYCPQIPGASVGGDQKVEVSSADREARALYHLDCRLCKCWVAPSRCGTEDAQQ